MTSPQPRRTGERSASDGIPFQAPTNKAKQQSSDEPSRVASIFTHSKPAGWLRRRFSVKSNHRPPQRAPAQLPPNFSQLIPILSPEHQKRPCHGWDSPPLPLSPLRSRRTGIKPIKLPDVSIPSPSSSDITDWSGWAGPPSESSLLESAREELMFLEAEEAAMMHEVRIFLETGNMEGIKWLIGL